MNIPPAFGRITVVAGAALLAFLATARADSIDKLQGYWAAQTLGCNEVFQKEDGAVHFAKIEGFRRQGLIIRNKSIEGQNADCEIRSLKDVSNGTAAALSCKTQIMFDTLVVRFRLNNDNELVQFDPDMPDLTTTYKRCTM
jgi:hypothetical protein